MARLKKAPVVDFEQSLVKLESIVTQIEQGNLSLEASLSKFKQGIHLVQESQRYLKMAEQEIQVLLSTEEGNFLFPFEVNNSINSSDSEIGLSDTTTTTDK